MDLIFTLFVATHVTSFALILTVALAFYTVLFAVSLKQAPTAYVTLAVQAFKDGIRSDSTDNYNCHKSLFLTLWLFH
jgi:hypothetical protein